MTVLQLEHRTNDRINFECVGVSSTNSKDVDLQLGHLDPE